MTRRIERYKKFHFLNFKFNYKLALKTHCFYPKLGTHMPNFGCIQNDECSNLRKWTSTFVSSLIAHSDIKISKSYKQNFITLEISYKTVFLIF